MRGKITIILLSIIICSFKFSKYENHINTADKFEINWVEKIDSNFDFANNWSYPENVFRNNFGQLICDNICPDEIEGMKDEEGKIKKESLKSYYEIIDTTHLFQSLKCETNAPEFGSSEFINISKLGNEKILVSTSTNVSTHSSLNIEIEESNFSAWIDFGSITPIGNHKFKLTSGVLNIEKPAWQKGIIKAEFDFNFDNTMKALKSKDFNWKGKLLKRIE